MRLDRRIVGGFVLLSLAAFAVGAETRLALASDHWETRKNSGADVPAGAGGVLALSPDSLAVGSWLTGTTSPRFEYRERLPHVHGTILGRYRTTGLLPRQARVRLQFFEGERSLASRDYALAAATEWTELTVPIIRPPCR